MNRKYLIPTIILLGTIYCNIAKVDWFPFSNYPMYSQLFKPTYEFQVLEFAVVEESGSEHEIETKKYLQPFWNASFREALFYNKDYEVVKKKLKPMLALYNKRLQQAGKPKVIALRVYLKNYVWQKLVDQKLEAEIAIRPEPESRELKYEAKAN